MLITTKIISLDDANKEIEQCFHETVKKWLDTIWNIMAPRIPEDEVRRVKEAFDSVITSNSPSELDNAMSWSWKVSRIEAIDGGTAGKLVLYVADVTLKLKEHEGITRTSITTPRGKTLHVETDIVV